MMFQLKTARALVLIIPGIVLTCLRIGSLSIPVQAPNAAAYKNVNESSTASNVPSTTSRPTEDDFFKRPRIMIAGGCVGSTAVMTMTLELFRMHGIQTYPIEYESMKAEKNWKYQMIQWDLWGKNQTVDYEDVMLQSIQAFNQDAIDNNQVLVFKGHLDAFRRNPRLVKGLQDMGTLFSVIYRQNALDRCVCSIRDCFNYAPGYPVFAENGTKADNFCIERRSFKNIKTKAWLKRPKKCFEDLPSKTSTMNYRVPIMDDNNQKTATNIGNLVAPSEPVTTEDLFQYQYSNEEADMQTSMRAWSTYFRSFLGDRLDEKILRDYLNQNANSRPPPGPHSEAIYNLDSLLNDVQPEVLEPYLRRDT